MRTIPDLAARYQATILDFRLAWLLFMPAADRALWTIHDPLSNRHVQTDDASVSQGVRPSQEKIIASSDFFYSLDPETTRVEHRQVGVRSYYETAC
jgi:hypothetical protein